MLAGGTEVPGLVEQCPTAHRCSQVVEAGHQVDGQQVTPLVGDLVREDRPAVVQGAVQVPVHAEDLLGVRGVVDDLVAEAELTQDITPQQRAHAVVVQNPLARGVEALDASTDRTELLLPVQEEEVPGHDGCEGQSLKAQPEHLPAVAAQRVPQDQSERVDDAGKQDDAERPHHQRQQAVGGLFVFHETRHYAHSFRFEPRRGCGGDTRTCINIHYIIF